MANNSELEQGVATRLAAVHVLEAVLDRQLTLDEALTRIAKKSRLGDDDRRLVHAIAASVFRNLPYIDDALKRLMQRDSDPRPKLLHHLLRVGVAQLWYLAVAPHAAVHTCVSAAVSLKLNTRKSLVNAVLRAAQREHDAGVTPETDALKLMAPWLAERWVKNYGQSKAHDLAMAMRQEAPIDVTMKDPQASLEWARLNGGEEVLPGAVRVLHHPGQVTSWPGFDVGAWWVQDLASSLPIKLLSNVSGKSVLDMCAAPGGKTMQLAALGAKVTALDAAPARMARLTENLARTGLSQRVETLVADARTWQPKVGPADQPHVFDAVVLDAPCSATGTLRRHPELPWIHSQNQVEKMTLIQRDLLRRACDWAVNGGVVLYITCSMEPEEGEAQVESLLAERNDIKLISDMPALMHPYLQPGFNNIGFRTNPAIQTPAGGMDGFFMALLKKV